VCHATKAQHTGISDVQNLCRWGHKMRRFPSGVGRDHKVNGFINWRWGESDEAKHITTRAYFNTTQHVATRANFKTNQTFFNTGLFQHEANILQHGPFLTRAYYPTRKLISTWVKHIAARAYSQPSRRRRSGGAFASSQVRLLFGCCPDRKRS
jgi:hypothetical protein